MTGEGTASLEVRRPCTCLGRGEASVERLSHETTTTPAAARDVPRAVLRKPRFDREVREISVANPIRWAAIARDEVPHGASRRRSRGALGR